MSRPDAGTNPTTQAQAVDTPQANNQPHTSTQAQGTDMLQTTNHAQAPHHSQSIIHASNLSKWYGEVIGLNNLNLDINSGITGIVGPNGSGKSTLFKLITGMIKPSVGTIQVLGQNPWGNISLMRDIGFCPDFDFLASDVTGKEYLNLLGGLHAMSGATLEKRVEEMANLVQMTDALDRKMGGYSKGMKQRMKIAGSMLHAPKLLLLDEPLSGTDPLVRRDIMELIERLHQERGHTVVVSSHVLSEVEKMTSNIALIYKGRAIAVGNISEIRGLIDKHPHNVIIEGKDIQKLAKRLLDEDFTRSVGYNDNRSGILVQISRPDEFFTSLPKIVNEIGSEIDTLYSLDDNLEAVFRYLVGG